MCGFNYIQAVAGELGIGYVQITKMATFWLSAQAEPDTLKNFVEYLHEGSVLSLVEGVAVEWRTAEVFYNDFSVK